MCLVGGEWGGWKGGGRQWLWRQCVSKWELGIPSLRFVSAEKVVTQFSFHEKPDDEDDYVDDDHHTYHHHRRHHHHHGDDDKTENLPPWPKSLLLPRLTLTCTCTIKLYICRWRRQRLWRRRRRRRRLWRRRQQWQTLDSLRNSKKQTGLDMQIAEANALTTALFLATMLSPKKGHRGMEAMDNIHRPLSLPLYLWTL